MIFIYSKISDIQSIRLYDPLWLNDLVYPYFYFIIFSYAIILSLVFIYNFQHKFTHILLLSQVALISYATPYFLSGAGRFPDTFSVASDSLIIGENLSTIGTGYSQSFPGAYILFYIIHSMANIDLVVFSKIIFTPILSVSIILLWYYIAVKLTNDNRIAFLASVFCYTDSDF